MKTLEFEKSQQGRDFDENSDQNILARAEPRHSKRTVFISLGIAALISILVVYFMIKVIINASNENDENEENEHSFGDHSDIDVPLKDLTWPRSNSDSRDFKFKTLGNDLSVLMLSKPDSQESGIALCVRAGSYMDHFDGTAHMLEHSLFLGSEYTDKLI